MSQVTSAQEIVNYVTIAVGSLSVGSLVGHWGSRLWEKRKQRVLNVAQSALKSKEEMRNMQRALLGSLGDEWHPPEKGLIDTVKDLAEMVSDIKNRVASHDQWMEGHTDYHSNEIDDGK